MAKQYFIGVDGGASKCRLRLEDENGGVLGEASSGPANIRISVEQAWSSIYTALNNILMQHSLSLQNKAHEFHLGIGIAGCEIQHAYHQFKSQPHGFKTMLIESDAHTACLGAHQGEDGAIVIVGTGVVGYRIEKQKITKMGGLGFPHDDAGGGAYLGLQAIAATCKTVDGRMAPSALSSAVLATFNHQVTDFIAWANQANSSQFAKFAPLVIQQAEAGEEIAVLMLKHAAQKIEHLISAIQTPDLPIAMLGGISPFLLPYFPEPLCARLQTCQLPPEAGAILMVRKHLENAV